MQVADLVQLFIVRGIADLAEVIFDSSGRQLVGGAAAADLQDSGEALELAGEAGD
jgi:hypothetical protein